MTTCDGNTEGLGFIRRGDKKGAPVVLLHGFGGTADGWKRLLPALSAERQVLAFDLPGHGASLDYPETCNAVVAAKAVLSALDTLEIGKAHFVGHSMGGAVASLIGLRALDRAASLTLLAPGGFGPEINHRLLRSFARAQNPDGLLVLLEQFYGWEFLLPDELIDQVVTERARPGVTESLCKIAEAIIDDRNQKVLPRAELADIGCPVKVVWGTQDRVLPTRQSHKLPGTIATHIFERVGHMPHHEIPAEVTRLILENVRSE
ncbi:alpha/beta fold hydrolase [Coralliovum pocilloporae]|uniref:alpha/beta fold hydrolase n=1 Tax=Coralliovum pocilloporae TaxID=3066369 RepID=UPI0033077039